MLITITTRINVTSFLPFCFAIAVVGIEMPAARAQEKIVVTDTYDLLKTISNSLRSSDFSGITQYLQFLKETELCEIDKVCHLSDRQRTKIEAAIDIDISGLIGNAKRLAQEYSETIETAQQNLGFNKRLIDLNKDCHQGYLVEGRLTKKVLESSLSPEQKKDLCDYYLRGAVTQLVNAMTYSFDQQDALVDVLRENLKNRSDFVFDRQYHLSYLQSVKPSFIADKFGEGNLIGFQKALLNTLLSTLPGTGRSPYGQMTLP